MELGGGGRGADERVQQQLQSVGRLAAYLGKGFLLSAGDGGSSALEWGRWTDGRHEVESGILFFL